LQSNVKIFAESIVAYRTRWSPFP